MFSYSYIIINNCDIYITRINLEIFDVCTSYKIFIFILKYTYTPLLEKNGLTKILRSIMCGTTELRICLVGFTP